MTKSSLLKFVFMSMFFFYQISKAQVVSLTLNIADWMTVTETTTLSVLGACFSYRPYLTHDSSLAFCRRYRQLNSASLEEKISNPHDNNAVLYNPSTVEKLEVTIVPEEKSSLINSDIGDTIRIQSSANAELDDLSKANFFSPIINNGTGTTVNYNIQSLFAFIRPFFDAWSAMVGATSTFFSTIKLTHTTIEYVKETTSTTTLLINACNDFSILNSILHEHVPKCKTLNSTHNESSTTTGLDSTTTTLSSSTTPVILESTTGSTTEVATITNGTSTTSGQTTPVSHNSNSSLSSSSISTTLSTTATPLQNITEVTSTEATSTTSQNITNITNPATPSSTTDETTTYLSTTYSATTDWITTDATTADPITTDATTMDWITTDETTMDWITTDETTTDSDGTTMDSIPTDRPNTTETTTVHENISTNKNNYTDIVTTSTQQESTVTDATTIDEETSTTGHTTHHTTTPSTWSPSITESIIPDTLAPNVTNTSTTQQQEVDGTTTAVYTGTETSITLSNGTTGTQIFENTTIAYITSSPATQEGLAQTTTRPSNTTNNAECDDGWMKNLYKIILLVLEFTPSLQS